MVLLHVRNDVETQFIVETTTSSSVDEATRLVIETHNARLRLMRLAQAVDDLAASGPVDVDAEAAASSSKGKDETDSDDGEAGETDEADAAAAGAVPRVGVPPPEDMAELLRRAAADVRDAIAPGLAERRQVMRMEALAEAEERVKGCVVLAYGDAGGLPETDPVRLILDGNEVLDGTPMARMVFDPAEAVLWWAKKQMTRGTDAVLSDFIGRTRRPSWWSRFARTARRARHRATHPSPRRSARTCLRTGTSARRRKRPWPKMTRTRILLPSGPTRVRSRLSLPASTSRCDRLGSYGALLTARVHVPRCEAARAVHLIIPAARAQLG
ncbi:uncharacterized protein AMSG_04506 [Thecamonas trahens ATCC 50062]|uniref:Uncharacterized protein n=1 Tax=Thecamonas trahens ATCC 50062 TaxID=461836 RepID=A0A0L0D878_THETB|nr:hypothetical protein AMSG_04506 [Thecamonas trahens ATCC 50062]KNC48276.1 hypothetical protein AMSG_04506 [Thecamonas trahens ATCC 50062]|eukprot:XP_013758843.1 hypothetical protein AMSG_04506 [Thecamonas trahens ATCC 50062]